jgi:hypothetical protein
MIPIQIDTIKDKYHRDIPIFITTTSDNYFTIWPDLAIFVVIENNYPRFTTVEKTEEYWNKIKSKLK